MGCNRDSTASPAERLTPSFRLYRRETFSFAAHALTSSFRRHLRNQYCLDMQPSMASPVDSALVLSVLTTRGQTE